MTAASKLGVYATGATTAGPLLDIIGSAATAVTFPDEEAAERFANGCMDERIPAARYGTAVIILHD